MRKLSDKNRVQVQDGGETLQFLLGDVDKNGKPITTTACDVFGDEAVEDNCVDEEDAEAEGHKCKKAKPVLAATL